MGRYEDETKDAILQRMLDASPEDIDKRQGSITWDLLSPASIEIAEAYIQLDNVLRFGFASEDQPSEYLDLRVAEVGLKRKEAQKATGQVTFTGDEGVTVPEGTVVYTDEEYPVYFVTTEEGTVGVGETEVTVNAEAKEGGAEGNVSAGEITLISGDLAGITEVNNNEAFEGGTDTETDEALLDRYFRRVQRPPTSGNVYHYEEWALSVPGVGGVVVQPLWDGPGTVKVIIIDDEKTAPTQTIINNTTEFIEEERPVGVDLTVEGANEVSINVTAEIILVENGSLANVIEEFTTNFEKYLYSLAFIDPIVRYSVIANIILDCKHVLDYQNLLVNNDNTNIAIPEGEIAIAGVVNFNEAP